MAPRALLFVLAMTTGSIHAFGATQAARGQILCYAVRPGDTAASLARRLTGSADNRHRRWFHIVNPATATAVGKFRYDTIQSGWHVCVPTERLARAQDDPISPPQSATVPIEKTPAPGAIDLRVLWWVVPLSVAVSGLVLAGTGKYVGHRRAVVEIMSGFGGRFVSEFERPLFRRTADAAVTSRLRFAPARRRLEILLAPAAGPQYPNLIDPQRTLEHDD